VVLLRFGASSVQVTQDGDTEGVFKLDRLPTEDEAALIRDMLGIRRRPNL
jgi:hypothetical protein